MSEVTIASYNVHFGVGLDGEYDCPRIANAVRSADIVCFQEITRGYIANGGADMVGDLKAELTDRFCAFHAPCDIDMGSRLDGDGHAVSARMQFGNMVASRWPIASVRGHLLPRRLRLDGLNLQRGMLECVIDTPLGVLSVNSIHLDHLSGAERLDQITVMHRLAQSALKDGTSISGTTAFGMAEPAMPEHFIVAGDFNCLPGSREHQAMTARGVVDVTAATNAWSWTDPDCKEPDQRLDYMLCDPALASLCMDVNINQAENGSDHMPVFARFSD